MIKSTFYRYNWVIKYSAYEMTLTLFELKWNLVMTKSSGPVKLFVITGIRYNQVCLYLSKTRSLRKFNLFSKNYRYSSNFKIELNTFSLSFIVKKCHFEPKTFQDELIGGMCPGLLSFLSPFEINLRSVSPATYYGDCSKKAWQFYLMRCFKTV